MKTAIMTDTNSGLTAAKARRHGIYLLPMPVLVDGKCYMEGVDIKSSQLFEAMAQDKNVSTSQPSPGDLTDMWQSILDEGYDEIVYIPMTSGLSSSCMSAKQLAEDFGSRVCVVDNHRISVTLMESALEARRLADAGKCAAEIRAYLEETSLQASIYLTVDSLKYLSRSGRMSGSAAAFGTLLNIKPILSIQGEKLDPFAKVRGMKSCEKKMIEALRNDLATRFAGIPAKRLRVATAGTLQNHEDVEHWKAMVQDAFPDHEVYYDMLPCSIACHIGPECKGIGVTLIGDFE